MSKRGTINKKKVIIVISCAVVIAAAIGFAIYKHNSSKEKIVIGAEDVNLDNLKKEKEDEGPKSLDDLIEEFGGQKLEMAKPDTCYVTKDGKEYTIYSDGEIVEGTIIPWDGQSAEPAKDEAGNYNVYTPQELKWIADQVISGESNFSGVTITLRKSIDLGARENEDGTWDGPIWNSIIGFLDENKEEGEANTQDVIEDTEEVSIDTTNANVIDENLKRFAGVFQAENATIRGMRVDVDKNYQGLFGFSSGIVQNITLKNSYVKGVSGVGAIVGLNSGKILNCEVINVQVVGNDKIGGACGIASTGSFIEDTEVDSKCIIKAVTNNAGGISGYTNNNSAINRCIFSGVLNGKKYIGGVTGVAFYGVQINGCKTEGASISGDNYVGGLVGYNRAQIEKSSCDTENSSQKTSIKGIGNVGGIVGVNYVMGNIENVVSYANIEASGDNIGGIAGINNASISNAINKGNVTVQNEISLKVGGIVGENASDSFIYTSCNEGTITNQKHAGGVYGANFGQTENCIFLDGSVKTDNIEDAENAKIKDDYYSESNKIEREGTSIPTETVEKIEEENGEETEEENLDET